MSDAALHIRRWRTECLVARDHAAPQRARAELDALAERLPEQISAALGDWSAEQPDAIVLIERLVLECELDLSREPHLLGAHWAQRFARALVAALRSEAEGVLYFPSRAAYRARFIADLAAGAGAQAWYYRAFDGLRALPAPAVIRTVLLEDAALGRATLAELDIPVWNRLATLLTRAEAARILDGLVQHEHGEEPAAPALAALLARAGPLLPPGASAAVGALCVLALALQDGLVASPGLLQWVRLAGKLPQLARHADARNLRAALERGDAARLAAADPERDGQVWAALVLHPGWGPLLAQGMALAPNADPLTTDAAAPAHTAFGGLALLLPELDALLDAELVATLPTTADAHPRALAAWLALAHCAGTERARRFLSEAMWRDFFAIAPQIDAGRIAECFASSDASAALARLADGAARLARGKRVIVPWRGATRLLVDEPTGIWIAFTGATPDPATPWRSRLATARRARRDGAYLGAHHGLPADWQRFFLQLAQIALRRFAWRIPGFAGSSLAFLQVNFLCGAGCWDAATGQLSLARPPLQALLDLTGLARGALHWGGPPARRLLPEYPS